MNRLTFLTNLRLAGSWLLVALLSCVAFAQCDGKTGYAQMLCQAQGNASANALSSAADQALADFKRSPLTTSLADAIHTQILPETVDPQVFTSLFKLSRTNDDGSFILKPGIYEARVESFSLEPYDQNYARSWAFFPAPFKGKRAKVISAILKYAEIHPDVPQAYIQNLLGLTVYGTDLEKMPTLTQQAAAKLLPKELLAQLHGETQAIKLGKILIGTIGRHAGASTGAETAITGVVAKEKELEQTFNITGTVKDLAAPSSQPVLPGVDARGTWAQMPGGFFVRYLPEGYARTRLQVLVPEAAMEGVDPKKPLTFDPTQYLAVHVGTPAQRLGISLRPVGGR